MGKKIGMIAMSVIMLSALVGLAVLYYIDSSKLQQEKVLPVSAINGGLEELGKVQQSDLELKMPQTEVRVDLGTKPLKVVAVGDILLGRTVKQRVELKAERYVYPFLKVADFTRNGDVVFGNLEESITASTISLTGIHQGGKYVLKNEVEAMDGIKYVGFNMLSLANNHILDYYDKGLDDTIDILNKNNIAHAGAGKNLDEARKMAVIEKNGLKIGLLAYTDMSEVLYKGKPPIRFIATKDKAGVAPTNEEYIKEDVARVKGSVDLLIVSFHWGVENSYNATEKQVEFAHYLMDNGVDMVLGHHPHRVQAVEIYKGKPIFYSLGNFMFDQNYPENQEGFIMNMEFTDKKLTSLIGTPFRILDKAQIVPQKGLEATASMKRELKLCEKFNTKCKIEKDSLVFELN